MLDMVLDRMTKFYVRLKPTKCSFGMNAVEFLGHIFDKNGVHLSEKKVQGIRDFPIPRSVLAVRSSVGMVNYLLFQRFYSIFIILFTTFEGAN